LHSKHWNSVFPFSVHNQGQISKTTSKNKSMHSLINDCCETHFHLLRMFLRSFIRHNITDFFLLHLEYEMALNKIPN